MLSQRDLCTTHTHTSTDLHKAYNLTAHTGVHIIICTQNMLRLDISYYTT